MPPYCALALAPAPSVGLTGAPGSLSCASKTMFDQWNGTARMTSASDPCGVGVDVAGSAGCDIRLQPTATNAATMISPHNRFIRALLGLGLSGRFGSKYSRTRNPFGRKIGAIRF